jgi:spore coat polysaccharide biosynthesis protein SpsF
MKFKTKQEILWSDDKWSREYIERNNSESLLASNIALFSQIISRTNHRVETVFEIGTNIGLNLDAIKTLLPSVLLSGIEISKEAYKEISKKEYGSNILNESILNLSRGLGEYDLVFTKGVLIHLNPEYLMDVYEKIYNLSKKYILFVEYYNPSPVSIRYRDKEGMLYKRDFSREFLDLHPKCKLLDYGFVYRYDNNYPQDDLTWFLMEKVT